MEEIPLGQGDSRQEVEQESFWSEPSDQDVQDFAQEIKQKASLLDTLDTISGCSSKSQEMSNCHLGFVGECMLHDWYQPTVLCGWKQRPLLDSRV